MIGRRLAHYEITELLGKGGMGEVYRAHDTKLGRDVALKLLPGDVASDPERLARFQREAKLLATLGHPSIAGLHGLEESDGEVFLVMELAEGEDLARRLQQGPMPMDEALDAALQIAEALEAAHAKSIVHRDLKPANVMVTPSGRVKLLDFGLARAYHADEASGDPMMSPTLTAAMTQQGVILGTAAYMSPEQARGKAVDAQSDIWAFGVVLYEMLTGHRLFQGETISDSIGAILHKEPDWTRLPPETPPQVRQLLARCLERSPAERLHHIAEARVAILDGRRDPDGSRLGFSGLVPERRSSRRGIIAGAAALAGLVIGLAAGLLLFRSEAPRPYRIYDLGVDIEPSQDQALARLAAVSPDGDAVVYTHQGQLWVQSLDEQQPIPLAQTERGVAPFWSPDGSQVGWFEGSRVMKTTIRGGRPVALCELNRDVAGGVGAHWTGQGRILFSTGWSGIRTVSDQGGPVNEILAPGEGFGDLHEPFGLPDDRGIIFVSHPDQRGPSILEILRDGSRRVLFEAETGARIWSPCYDPAGYVLFRLTRTDLTWGLWALPFDIGTGEATGEPFLVEADASGATITRDGDLVYVLSPRQGNERTIVRVGLNGGQQETLTSSRPNGAEFALSPNGRWLAFTADVPDGEGSQVWVRDLERGVETQLTARENNLFFEFEWTADSRHLQFIALDMAAETTETARLAVDGSEPWTVISDRPGVPAPDGEQMVFVSGPGGRRLGSGQPDTTEVWVHPLGDPESGRFLLGGDATYFPAGFSAGGSYMLYYTDRAGERAIYLARFPEGTGRWKVSRDTDVRAEAFAADGSAIYYVSGEQLFRVGFTEEKTPRLGRPEIVGEVPAASEGRIQIHPDGDSYLVSVAADRGEASGRRSRVKITRNWTAKLGPR